MAGFFYNLIESVSHSSDQNMLKLCQAGIHSMPQSTNESHMRIITTDEPQWQSRGKPESRLVRKKTETERTSPGFICS